MRKRRIFAMLLAACMIVESTAVASASETELPAVNTVESEPETPVGDPAAGDKNQVPAEDDTSDKASETPKEGISEGQAPEKPSEKLDGGTGEEQTEGTQQPPAEEPGEEKEQDPGAEENPTDAPEEGVPEGTVPEEDIVGVSETMSQTEPLADGEITQGGTDIMITALKIRQEYGAVGLGWKYAWNEETSLQADAVFKCCRVYRSESKDGSYDQIWESNDESGHYMYLDDTVERVAGGAANKTYYYKVSVVYNRTEKDEYGGSVGDAELYESVLSDAVSNKDAYYCSSAYPLFISDEPGDDGYIGACVTDDAGNRLDELTLTEGKVTSLRVAGIKADGTSELITGNCDAVWYLCRQSYTGKQIREQYTDDFDRLGDDKVTVLPEMGEEEVKDSHVYMKALPGSASGDTYYLVFWLDKSGVGSFVWQIPVHIVPGDGSDEQIEVDGLYTSKEALCQAIRDTMVARKDAVFRAIGGSADWWKIPSESDYPDYDFEDVFDFHREREGMKPWEGDYLDLAIGAPDSEEYSGTWMETGGDTWGFNNVCFMRYTITPQFITTRAQEDQVDQKINELIYTEGGALYSYRDASDFAKVKAAYDYVRGHVRYTGTPTPIYHTCYSALINGQATCQGYALLFYRLVRELGIPCRVLMGMDANAHTYNIVQMGDNWYYVDTNAGVLLKGTNDFKPATLQSQYLTENFQKEYISKIPKASYAGAEIQVSSLEAASGLTAEEIQAIDGNLTAAAADRMTVDYKINGAAVKVSGTVKYLEGCSRYLGYEEDKNMPTSGYFLSLKLAVDASKFKEDGKLTVSYSNPLEERKEVSYAKADLAAGPVKMIVNVSQNPGMKIHVDYDGEGEESQYDGMVYDLDLSGLKKESQTESSGTIKEVDKYGIELSAPIVKKSGDGKTIDVAYEAVAYSDHVKWKEGDQEQKGNYIVLRMERPESVKATVMAETLAVTVDDSAARAVQTLAEGWNEAAGCYMETAADKSEIFLAMPVEKSFNRCFTVKWGGSDPLAFVQNLTVSVPAESTLEVRSENALLPGSIAFNGLVSTMYVGQSQNIHITFKKKYEQDEIQVFYTTDAADVVAVNRITGVLKALKPGTANITVSAVDKAGNVITKTAKITVKELPAPAGIKVASIKDNNVTVSWKANTTGQYTEVYAIPYRESVFGTNKKEWKNVVENAMKEAGMDETAFALLEDSEKSAKLDKLKGILGTGSWSAASVPAKDSSVKLEGMQAETEYVVYVRNVSKTAASTVVFSGVANDKITTKKLIFDSIRLKLKRADGTVISSKEEGNDGSVYVVTDLNREEPVELSYVFLDGEDKEISSDPVFTSAKFTSSNKSAVKVTTTKDAPAALSYGNQVGDAVLTVVGKDASGTQRTSEQIIVRVVKAPALLKDKSTTLTIGQSVPVKELIGTDLKGTAAGINLDGVDFTAVVKAITDSGCFAVTYPETEGSQTQNARDAVITAAALIDGKSGNKIEVPFKMGDSTAKAKIQIKDMAAASIGKITVRDTSAQIEFKPSPAVTAIQENSRYYTLRITDKVTGETVEAAAQKTAGNPYSCTFKESVPDKSWICEVEGLSSNKAYEAVITAHFNAGDKKSEMDSKAKKFTTKKPLLDSEGSIAVNYVSLDELRANPNAAGTRIVYESENGIKLENNGTYVFMAQISNLARTLETDKLKWAISSGDKKAASVKASSSSYEMQLTTTRTGTFTVTATSTVTKEPVATFAVTVIPYQSGGAGAPEQPDPAPDQNALLPEAYTGILFKSKREEVA